VSVTAGDRLPAVPKHKASLGIDYTRDIFSDYSLDLNYNVTSQSSVLTKVGGRAGGERLGGYTVSNASVGIGKDNWQVSLYGLNLFNKYAYTAVSEDTTYIFKSGDFDTRYYSRTIIRPREVGLEFRYDF
jgi:outer membrane receptor protein involved in Fe transport